MLPAPKMQEQKAKECHKKWKGRDRRESGDLGLSGGLNQFFGQKGGLIFAPQKLVVARLK